jgi:hypothetical protein
MVCEQKTFGNTLGTGTREGVRNILTKICTEAGGGMGVDGVGGVSAPECITGKPGEVTVTEIW